MCRLLLFLSHGLLSLWSSVIVGELDANLSSILALTVKCVPSIRLSAAGIDDIVKADECVTDQLSLPVIVENGDLDALVIRRVVDSEA